MDNKSCNPSISLETVVSNLVSLTLSSRYWTKLRWGYFWISGQSLIKENCNNSRTSDDIDMKRGPVTKLDKRNKIMSKKFDVDVMLEKCDIIGIFQIFGQFGAVRRPNSGHSMQNLCFQQE